MGLKTLETARIRAVAEIKAECVVARERLIARGDPDLVDDSPRWTHTSPGSTKWGSPARRTPYASAPSSILSDASTDEALRGSRTKRGRNSRKAPASSW